MFIAGAALLAVLFVGRSAGGASRWLGTGSFQFQPSELAKLALVLFAADVLARREGKLDWVYRAAPVLLGMGAFVLSDNEAARHGHRGRALLLWCRSAFCGRHACRAADGPGCGRRRARVSGGQFGQLPSRPADVVPSPVLACQHHRLPVGPGPHSPRRGHWFGTGIGQSLASWGYLPNQYTDFIFAVIGQETGFAGSVVVLGLFAAIGVVGTQVAWRAPTTFESLLAAGITAWLVSQAIINIGAVAGLCPSRGCRCPLSPMAGRRSHRPVRDRPSGERCPALLGAGPGQRQTARRPSRGRAAAHAASPPQRTGRCAGQVAATRASAPRRARYLGGHRRAAGPGATSTRALRSPRALVGPRA